MGITVAVGRSALPAHKWENAMEYGGSVVAVAALLCMSVAASAQDEDIFGL